MAFRVLSRQPASCTVTPLPGAGEVEGSVDPRVKMCFKGKGGEGRIELDQVKGRVKARKIRQVGNHDKTA